MTRDRLDTATAPQPLAPPPAAGPGRAGRQARAAAGADEAPPGGHALLWVLIVVALGLMLLRPQSPSALLALVDWQTVGALAGLLAITQAVEHSGVLQTTARRLLSRVTHQRTLALGLVSVAAVLSALVTNDVSLFLLVPLTRVLATQAELPLARLRRGGDHVEPQGALRRRW